MVWLQKPRNKQNNLVAFSDHSEESVGGFHVLGSLHVSSASALTSTCSSEGGSEGNRANIVTFPCRDTMRSVEDDVTSLLFRIYIASRVSYALLRSRPNIVSSRNYISTF